MLGPLAESGTEIFPASMSDAARGSVREVDEAAGTSGT